MKILLLALSAIAILFTTSCTKVVDIDLNKSNPQYIVEGNITNAAEPQVVHISRSVNFSEANEYPPVTNAVVTVSDDLGNSDTLRQDDPGYYKASGLIGVPGRRYTLQVLVDGRTFTAVSTMPQAIHMDDLQVVEQSSFGKLVKAPQVTFYESDGTGNYYYFQVYRNDQRVRTIYIDNDMANDGKIVNRTLPDVDSSYQTGDEVSVELQSISKSMYDYLFSLQQTIGQSSATPANPVTNITGGNVLGYFSAHTSDRRKLVVQ